MIHKLIAIGLCVGVGGYFYKEKKRDLVIIMAVILILYLIHEYKKDENFTVTGKELGEYVARNSEYIVGQLKNGRLRFNSGDIINTMTDGEVIRVKKLIADEIVADKITNKLGESHKIDNKLSHSPSKMFKTVNMSDDISHATMSNEASDSHPMMMSNEVSDSHPMMISNDVSPSRPTM